MNMIELIAGIAIGAGCMVAKDKYCGSSSFDKAKKVQEDADRLSDENERLRKKVKDSDDEVERLNSEIESLKRIFKDIDDDSDDLQDDLASAKKEIQKLKHQNEELSRTIQDYKNVCANYEQELAKLKK